MIVWLVEDHPLVAKTFIRAFEAQGHKVRHFSDYASAQIALITGSAEPAQRLVLDQRLGDGVGWDLAPLAPPECKVIRIGAEPNADFVKGHDPAILFAMLE